MYLLVADDLTGGNDAGIQFAKRGMDTWIVLDARRAGLNAVLARPRLPDMLVLNANTRNLAAADASARITTMVSRLSADARTACPDVVYKKIDSTLRGNIGAEIDALMDGYGFKAAFLTPTFIECGRTVVDGQLYVDGVPVHQTAFADDPITPVRQSSIAAVLNESCGRSAGCVPLSVMSQGEGAIAAYVADLQNAGHEIIIFDAVSSEHLDALVAVGQRQDAPPLYVGSAGLAGALAAGMPRVKSASAGAVPVDRVLFICGSAHAATRRQTANLARVGVPLIHLADAGAEAVKAAAAATLLALEKGDAVLCTPEEKISVMETLAADGIILSNALGQAAACVLEKVASAEKTTALVMTGGETAFAVLQKICSGLALSREVSPGVALATVVGGPCDGFQVVTKAGGFGDDGTLADIRHIFRPDGGR